MNTSLGCVMLTGCFFLIFSAALIEHTLAAQRASKGQPSSIPAKAPRSSTDMMQKKAAETKPVSARNDAKATAAETPVGARKRHRAMRASKKVVPKALVQPRTDLMHYGVLENAQRYDPRPHAHPAGVPNPQTSDLTHDHFQELDRNQDGAIDPVERAFGRIDMDRDLDARTLR
jgi:hypothetical protein